MVQPGESSKDAYSLVASIQFGMGFGRNDDTFSMFKEELLGLFACV
jgi:hypothetical protein